jgi:hypothetical protein
MPTFSRSLALLGLMAAATVPAQAQAGCAYLSVSIQGPSQISRYGGVQYYQAVPVGGTITPALYYTWSYRSSTTNYGSVWGPSSSHQGGEFEAVNQFQASCFIKRFELKVVVTDSCGVTATATKVVSFDPSECP